MCVCHSLYYPTILLYTTIQVFAAKCLLQVWGAAGAVWGASEALGFRTTETRDAWQAAAWATTVVFGLRWLAELFRYCLLCPRRRRDRNSLLQRLVQTFQTAILPWTEVLVTKFVLEVCGAAGAVWGCAEIATIRDASEASTRRWRALALAVGAVFLLRWMVQVHHYAQDQTESPLVTEPPRLQRTKTQDHLEDEQDDEDEHPDDDNNPDEEEQKAKSNNPSSKSDTPLAATADEEEDDKEEELEDTTTKTTQEEHELQLVENYGSTSTTIRSGSDEEDHHHEEEEEAV